jgi:hypothetical protein
VCFGVLWCVLLFHPAIFPAGSRWSLSFSLPRLGTISLDFCEFTGFSRAFPICHLPSAICHLLARTPGNFCLARQPERLPEISRELSEATPPKQIPDQSSFKWEDSSFKATSAAMALCATKVSYHGAR